MPVFFAVGCEDDVAGIELGGLLSADLDEAAAFGDVQGLPAVVRMPGAARSGCEADRGDVQLRGRQPAGDRVNPYVTGEGLGRSLRRGCVAGNLHLPLLRAGR